MAIDEITVGRARYTRRVRGSQVTPGGVVLPPGSTGSADIDIVVPVQTFSDPLAYPNQWPHGSGPGWRTVGEMVTSASTFPGMFTFNAVKCPIETPASSMLIPLARHTYRYFGGGIDRRFGQSGFRLPALPLEGEGSGVGDWIEWALGAFPFESGGSRPMPLTPWVLPSNNRPSLWVGFIPEPDGLVEDAHAGASLLSLTNGFWPGALLLAEHGLTYSGTLAYHEEADGTEGWPMLVEVPLTWHQSKLLFDPLWVAEGNATVPPGTAAAFLTRLEREVEPLSPGEIATRTRLEKEQLATLEATWSAAAAFYDALAAGEVEEEAESEVVPPLEASVRAIQTAVGERLIHGPFMEGIPNWAYSLSLRKPAVHLGLPDLTKAKGTLIVGFKAGQGGFFSVNQQGGPPVSAKPASESFYRRVELLGSAPGAPPVVGAALSGAVAH